jgi:uridine kinase
VQTSRIIIGVAGGTGSGKTTLCRLALDELGCDATMICQDMYYRDLSHLDLVERDNVNFDHPDSLDVELFMAHLERLKEGKLVEPPLYDFVTHTRSGTAAPCRPGRVILTEGIMLFTDRRVMELLDYKIFVDTDPDVRFIRRLRRDLNERGRTVESVITQWLSSVKPMYYRHVETCKPYADVIIRDDDSSLFLRSIRQWVKE